MVMTATSPAAPTEPCALGRVPNITTGPLSVGRGSGTLGPLKLQSLGRHARYRARPQPLGGELLRQPLVENRPGAAGMVGAGAVTSSKPDGHTLLMGSTSTLSMMGVGRLASRAR